MSAIRSLISDLRQKPEILPLAVLCTFASSFGVWTVYRNVWLRPDQSRDKMLTNWERAQLDAGKHYDAVALMLQKEAKSA